MNMLLIAITLCLMLRVNADPDSWMEIRFQQMEAQLRTLFQEQLDAALMDNIELRKQLQTIEMQHQEQQLQLKQDLKQELKLELREELRGELRQELKVELREELHGCSERLQNQHTGELVHDKATDLEIRVGHLEEDQTVLEQQMIVFDSKLVVTQAQVTAVSQQVTGVNVHVTGVENQVSALHNHVTEVQGRLNDSHELIADVKNRLEAIDERVKEVEGGSTDGSVDTRLDAVEKQVAQQQVETQRIHANVKQLQDNDQAVNIELGKQSKRLDVVESNSGASSGSNSFLAYLTRSKTGSQFTVVFDHVVYNRGSAYNLKTGEYTVPVDGVYAFSSSVMVDDESDYVQLELQVDGKTVAHTISTEPAAEIYDSSVSVTSQLLLKQGQRVSVYVDSIDAVSGDSNSNMQSWFSGHLIQK